MFDITKFDITKFVEFNQSGRGFCPCCTQEGKKRKNLSVLETGAYKCFRGHTPEQIREALGEGKAKIVPTAIAQGKPALVTAKAVEDAHKKLRRHEHALMWLSDRGISAKTLIRHKLGLYPCKVGKRESLAVGIPIPADESRQSFYIKKRVAPWDVEIQADPDYQAWKQWGIPPMVWFTHKPESATETWLCEGEWDAMMMRDLAEAIGSHIAVACFNCGAGSIPSTEQLDRLLGDVVVWYDLDAPGQKGAKKVQAALGSRCLIATVPSPEKPPAGWDVSDAIRNEFWINAFEQARAEAKPWEPEQDAPATSANPVRDRLMWNDDLLDKAPDYTDWLVPDLLTQNELFLLAAGARTGKSLLSMTLTKAVATGGEFLGRPTTQGTILYVAIEDSLAKLKEREQAQGWERGLPVVWLKKFKLSELPYLKEVAEEIDDLRLIVIDTLSRVKDSAVSESSAEMSQVLEPLQDMAEELDVCIVLVHHTGKVNIDNAQSVDIFDTIRGSSAIRAVCRGSMVLAAGERDYRLVVENGWGKHDLKVVLDANTLSWRLLGKWNPVSNQTQKDQILDFLKQVQSANIEQIADATGINKKVLYEQLSRLQISELAEEKVIKEGKRRNYTYRLALFNNIQQLNSVLNSENSDQQSDRGDIQQKIISDTPPVENQIKNQSEIENDSLKSSGIVEYRAETHTPQDFRLFNRYSTVEYKPGGVEYRVNDIVEILGNSRFYGQHVEILEISGDIATVKGAEWLVTQKYPLGELRFLKRKEHVE